MVFTDGEAPAQAIEEVGRQVTGIVGLEEGRNEEEGLKQESHVKLLKLPERGETTTARQKLPRRSAAQFTAARGKHAYPTIFVSSGATCFCLAYRNSRYSMACETDI